MRGRAAQTAAQAAALPPRILTRRGATMTQRVRVTYIARNRLGEATGIEVEENLLITRDEEVAYVTGRSPENENMSMFHMPGRFLLEDDCGLWYLPHEDCVEMVFLPK